MRKPQHSKLMTLSRCLCGTDVCWLCSEDSQDAGHDCSGAGSEHWWQAFPNPFKAGQDAAQRLAMRKAEEAAMDDPAKKTLATERQQREQLANDRDVHARREYFEVTAFGDPYRWSFGLKMLEYEEERSEFIAAPCKHFFPRYNVYTVKGLEHSKTAQQLPWP
jgi:hypothetical protein